jgi:hypothetical protein
MNTEVITKRLQAELKKSDYTNKVHTAIIKLIPLINNLGISRHRFLLYTKDFLEMFPTFTELSNEDRESVLSFFLFKKAGYMYVIKAPSLQYKIGVSADPEHRLRTLCHISGMELKFVLLKKTEDYKKLERVIHKEYKNFRVLGEWFLLSEYQLLTIRETYQFYQV